MNTSRIKRAASLLMTAALILSYAVLPADGTGTVYASGNYSASASVRESLSSALTVTSHPKNLTAKPGDIVRFSVSATGTGTLKYQWYYRKAGASDWTVWKNHTDASTEAMTNATWNMMQVRCRITDDNGSVTSNAATIVIDQPLTVLTQPKGVTVKTGVSATFSVSAQGKGALKYQWYFKKSGASDWTAWNGRTTAKTTATSNATWNMMKVRCKITDDNGSVYSNAATIVIDQPLVILTQPKDVTVEVNTSAKFSVSAQGKGALKYQWYYKKSGASDWTAWNGRTLAQFTAASNATWNLMQVRCKITDDNGSVTSDAAKIVVDQPLTVVTQPKDVTVEVDTPTKFSVVAQGKGALQYQWYYKKSGAADWTAWNGRTSAKITATSNATWNMMQVRCKITDENGSIYSNAAKIVIDQPLVILTQPKDVTVQVGKPTKFSVSAQGKGALRYQWYYKKADAADWAEWNGFTSAGITAASDATWNMMQVRCVITDDNGSVTSDAATVTVDQPLVVLTHPQNVSAKPGENVKFSVSAQGKGVIKYQWYYKKTDSESWTVWNGLTAASVSAVSDGTWNMMQVRCKVTDDAGSVNSRAAVVTINQALTIVTQPTDVFAKSGSTAQLSVKAQGTGVLTYQWYQKKAGAADWTLWSSHNTATTAVAFEAAMDGTQYYCEITDATGKTVKTNTVTAYNSDELRILKQPQDIVVAAGDTARFMVSACGPEPLSYQWYFKKAGRPQWITWTGKTTPKLTTKADCTWNGMQVYCKITDGNNRSINTKTAYAMITKQGDKRYFSRTITVKKNSTKIYSGVGTGTSVIATVSANQSFKVLSWDSDSSDTTWYSFNYNGRTAWIPRTSVSSSISYTTIPDRKFSSGGIPVIYLSPSRQTANLYAVGNTTEQQQMYKVANALKKILEEEYYCSVYIPSTGLTLGLKNRAYDAYIRESDVYLAIHSNSLSNGVKMHGATGFYFPACSQSYQLAQNIVNEMGKIEFKKSIVTNKLVNGMTSFDNTGYGEVRDPSYYGMISVLAEVEYHHYDAPAKWIINNTDKIARALANSLEKTLEMQKKK